jgi:predicted transcriptional regulator
VSEITAKALSVRQPWAQLVVSGLKTVEVRSWTTNYRGRLLIHSSKSPDEFTARQFRLGELPKGAIVGMVTLVDVRPLTAESWRALESKHLNLGGPTPGLYAWMLTDAMAFKRPVPFRGRPGLFTATIDLS